MAFIVELTIVCAFLCVDIDFDLPPVSKPIEWITNWILLKDFQLKNRFETSSWESVVFCGGTCKPWAVFVWLELTATFPCFFYPPLFFSFKFKAIVEEAILSEDNHVRTGDLLIIYVKMEHEWVGLPRIGEGELSVKFAVDWFLSLLAGSHLTGTYYNYLKPYSLFIPHFVRVICCLASSVCIRRHFTGNLEHIVALQPLNANFASQPQAGLRHWTVVEPGGSSHLSDVLVYCLCHNGNIVLPFQIIVNHCHSMSYDVLKLSFWMRTHHLTHKGSDLMSIIVI